MIFTKKHYWLNGCKEKKLTKKNIIQIFLPFLFIFFFLLPTPSFCENTPKIKLIKDQEYFPVVNEAIKEAKSSIEVIAFEMGYYPEHPSSPSNILIQNLIVAGKRGVDVRVILEVSSWNPRVTEKNKLSGRILCQGRVKVRYDLPFITTHAKLIIIDSNVAILGSNNWTYYSLTQNKELSLLVEGYPDIIKELENYFNKLWEESSPS